MHPFGTPFVVVCGLLISCSANPLDEDRPFLNDAGTPDPGGGGNAQAGGTAGTAGSVAACDTAPIPGLRALTPREYRQTLASVLGSAASAAEPLPEERVGRFDTEGGRASPSAALIERLATNAKAVGATFAAAASSLPCGATSPPTSTCANKVIDGIGPRLWRRPVTNAERATLLSLFERTRAQSGGTAAIEAVVTSLLLSPSFLLHIAEGEVAVDNTERRWLAPHELAHRLAFALWAEPADSQLLQTAAAGNLTDPKLLRAEVERMIDDARARSGVLAFYRQWLRLDRLADRMKDAARFPEWNQTLIDDATNEATQFITHNFFAANGSLQDLLNNPESLVAPKLAAIYGVAPSADGRVVLPLDQRSGILTRVAFLAASSGSSFTSPSSMGTHLVNTFFCGGLPPAPASVEFSPPPALPSGLTRRQALERTLASNRNCMGCHKVIDPLGFPFDGYDAIGQKRNTDNGQPIDTSGSVTINLEEEDITGSWGDALQLSRFIAEQPAARNCAAKMYWQYASGVNNDGALTCTERRLHAANADGSIRSTVLAALTDEGFRQVANTIKPESNVVTKPLPEADTAFETALIISADAFAGLNDRLIDADQRQLASEWQRQIEDLRRRLVPSRP